MTLQYFKERKDLKKATTPQRQKGLKPYKANATALKSEHALSIPTHQFNVESIARNYAFSAVSASSVESNSTTVTIWDPKLMMNLDRRRCGTCDEWFKDSQMLLQHQRDFTRYCRRCNIACWLYCRNGLPSELPECRLGCEKHKLCFDSGDDAWEHAQTEVHDYCFYKDCRSRATGDFAVEKHVKRRHFRTG